MLNENLYTEFEKLKETKEVLEGVVRITESDNTELGEDVLIIEQGKIRVLIPRSEMGLRPVTHSLIIYVGMKLQFIITHIDQENGYIVGSVKEVKKMQREQFVQFVEENPESVFEGTVRRVVKYGAYLDIQGVSVLLSNKDFSCDFTTVADIHKEGDVIQVRVLKVKDSKITVEATEKYCSDSIITFEDFQPKQVVYGTIRTIKTGHAFTCLAPNLDALSPIPPYFEVEEGMKVLFRINQVDQENKRIRGKIVKVLPQE